MKTYSALLLAILAASAGGGGCQPSSTPTPGNERRDVTSSVAPDLDFPNVTGFTRTPIRRFDDPKWGYSVAYNHPERLAVTIYVYNLGLGTIPDGISSPIVKNELARAKKEIYAAKEQGQWQTVTEREQVETLLGNGPNAPRFLRVSLQLGTSEGSALSVLFLTGYRNQFVKIRYTYLAASKDRCETDIERLLTAVGTALKQ